MSIERCYDHDTAAIHAAATMPTLSDETALIYCRVSSRKQLKEGDGLNSQEHRCRQFAEMRGYDVENVFLESVSGGLDLSERPALQALLMYLDAQQKNDNRYVVIFDDHKRFARDTEMHIKLRNQLIERGARIEYLNFTVDNTPEGQFIETMLAAQAQLERQQNGRQTKEKTKARLENGFWAFRAPIGYKYIQSKRGGKELVPEEPVASIIKERLEGFACGRFATLAELQRFLESQPAYPKDLPSGKLRSQSVVRLVEKPLYAGYLKSKQYNITLAKGNHPPLISLETFEKIQQCRRDNGYLPMRKDICRDFPLRGAVSCHACEKTLTAGWSQGKYKKYPYYFCRTKTCAEYGKTVARAKIEGAFETLLQGITPSQRMFDIARSMFTHAWELQTSKTAETVALYKQEITKAEKEITSLVKKIMDTNNPRVAQAYEDRIDELEKNKLIWAEKAANTKPQTHSFGKMFELSMLALQNPCKLWAEGSFEVKRTVLKLALRGR